MRINLCTYADKRYLHKLLALISSLKRNQPDWHLVVLGLDEEVQTVISDLVDQNISMLPLEALQSWSPRLAAEQDRRSWREYIFTLTPFLPAYLFERAQLPDVAYIDADCYLFHDLQPLYDELGAARIAAIPHRWTPRHAERLRDNGLFNVGWVYFQNIFSGRECLKDWAEDCLAHPGEDQTFLDKWPGKWGQAFHSVQHLGANLAPWNQEQYTYLWFNGQIWVEQTKSDDMGIALQEHVPVLFYHFHEFRENPDGSFYRTGYRMGNDVAEYIYEPYEQEITHVRRELARQR